MSGLGILFMRRGTQAHPTAGSDYIKFKDEEVLRVLMANGVSSDGVGITKEDAAKVTDIKYWFSQNSVITSFDELQYFTGLKVLAGSNELYGAFAKCTSLQSLILPDSIEELQKWSISNCTSLTNLVLPKSIKRLTGTYIFRVVPAKFNADFPLLETLANNAFCFAYGLQKVLNLGVITAIADGAMYESTFNRCNELTTAILPPTLTSIGKYGFSKNPLIDTIILRSASVPTIQTTSFNECPKLTSFYVRDELVDSYKSAANWSAYAAKIKGISQLATDNPSLYAEIKDYL